MPKKSERLEEYAIDRGSAFKWSQGEILHCLQRPERIAAMKKEHLHRVERAYGNRQVNPFRPDDSPIDIDEFYGKDRVRLACH